MARSKSVLSGEAIALLIEHLFGRLPPRSQCRYAEGLVNSTFPDQAPGVDQIETCCRARAVTCSYWPQIQR